MIQNFSYHKGAKRVSDSSTIGDPLPTTADITADLEEEAQCISKHPKLIDCDSNDGCFNKEDPYSGTHIGYRSLQSIFMSVINVGMD